MLYDGLWALMMFAAYMISLGGYHSVAFDTRPALVTPMTVKSCVNTFREYVMRGQ